MTLGLDNLGTPSAAGMGSNDKAAKRQVDSVESLPLPPQVALEFLSQVERLLDVQPTQVETKNHLMRNSTNLSS